ncbi:MAG: primase C-terminal domain-containing protein [Pseudomonadales bacterium]|nr:primase C-terminal domain-containing protein [Pseudomonadales bacterium]
MEAYADKKNNYRQRGFSMNLTTAQVKTTVKSVARWTWDRYIGNSKCHRGVMNLDKTLSLKERQKLAAERTHQTRQKATEFRIRRVCQSLLKKSSKLTQSAVARDTGLARQTIAKYQHILDEYRKPKPEESNVIALEDSSGQSYDVNYGVHQISALKVESRGLKKRSSEYELLYQISNKGKLIVPLSTSLQTQKFGTFSFLSLPFISFCFLGTHEAMPRGAKLSIRGPRHTSVHGVGSDK